MDEAVLFEAIDPELINQYQIYPVLANHYTKEAAFCQKVDALIHRTETQARDIFDIQLLLDRGTKYQCLSDSLCKKLDTAINNAISISFPEFKAQVVAYLMDGYQDYYNSPEIWSDIQEKVVTVLEKAKNQ